MSRASKTLLHKARQKVLRDHNYCCDVCLAHQGESGEYLRNEEFVAYDDFMSDWAIRKSRSVTKVHLRVLRFDAPVQHPMAIRHTVLCQRHAMQYINALRYPRK